MPRYRDRIIEATGSNPGKKAKALAAIVERDYGLKVIWKTRGLYIDRENIYGIASAAPSTPERGTGAPSTPTGVLMQASPTRSSPRRNVDAKIADLPRYRHRITDAIKANLV